MLIKHISVVDLKILLDDFTEEIRNNGKYNKIEYNNWKRLNSFIKDNLNSNYYLDNDIIVSWSAIHKKIWIKKVYGDNSSETSLFDFYDDDNSFGTWLWLNIFAEKIKESSSLNVTSADSSNLNTKLEDFNFDYATPYVFMDADANNTSTSITDHIRETVRDEIGVALYEYDKNINKNKKEEVNNMKGFNFDFGPVTGDVRMSIYGLAVKNASGTYVAYDKANKNIMDVDIFNFEGSKFLYKMPVAIKNIKAGDIVVHARKPMFVLDVNNDNTLRVVDPIGGEKKDILLTKSPFGFDFATKVVNFLDGMGVNVTAATEDNPFGNMWMLALLGDGKMDKDTLLPLMLMNQNGGNINPMMAFALMGDKSGNNDLLTMFALSSMMNSGNRDCNCHEAKRPANN